MMKVVWTDRAKQRLRELQDYIAKDAPSLAPQIAKRLIVRSRQLEILPQSGRSVPEYQHDVVRELLDRPYRIIYRILPDQVEILTVRHYRQLLPSDVVDF